MEDMGLDDAVEQLTTDEAEFPVNGRGGATGEAPRLGVIVRQGWVGVLEEGDCDLYESAGLIATATGARLTQPVVDP